MPYGSDTELDITRPVVDATNYTPTSSTVYHVRTAYGCPIHRKNNWTRSGTNASGKKSSTFGKRPGAYELVPVQVRKGPRLSYKVWSKRLGKYVWARDHIWIWKAKRKPSSVKPCTGLNLPPNALNYSSSRVSYFGGHDGQGRVTNYTGVYNASWQRSYTGDLWSGFVPIGDNSSLGPNPQNFTGNGICSSQFASVANRLSSELLGRLYEKVKNQHVNLAQALAEREQTASLVKDIAVRISKAVLALKRGNLPLAASYVLPKNSKQLANDWLILQYGIRPLISDLKGAASALTESQSFQFDVIVKRKESIPRHLLALDSNSSNFPHKTSVYAEGYVEVVYKARLQVESAFGQWASQTGLSNLSSLAWELTPYSFVADWLVPIGDYLNNQDAFSGLKVVHLHKTVFQKEYVTYERVCGGRSQGYLYPSLTCGFVKETVSCVRSILSGVPKLPYPSFRDPVSAGHIANAIALLRQLSK